MSLDVTRSNAAASTKNKMANEFDPIELEEGIKMWTDCVLCCANCARYKFSDDTPEQDIQNVAPHSMGMCERHLIYVRAGFHCDDYEAGYVYDDQ